MRIPWEHYVGLLGLVVLIVGNGLGLLWAPAEVEMGDPSRILYVHVPSAWTAMLALTIGTVGAFGYLFSGKQAWDWLLEAGVEVGVVLTILLLALGSLFAKPIWGVYWTWDPRLTTCTVMLLSFVGVLLLRAVVEDPDKRALRSSAASVLAFVNLPLTYVSVQWASLHQSQSTAEDFSPMIIKVLHVNNVAFLCLMIWFIAWRWRLARRYAESQAAPPLEDVR
ncbi:MAG: cytochrome c biogenesis protein CcsA [Proteobacteria bacterium]|nr:cytochrome c biogenesis protein CcsA [Pseudomonadota bacterium]